MSTDGSFPSRPRQYRLAGVHGPAVSGPLSRTKTSFLTLSLGKSESPACWCRRGRTRLLAENLRERGLLELQFGRSKDAAQVVMSGHDG
jgi:hypothetical protein